MNDVSSPSEEPTAEELALVLNALEEADASANRILESMDRSHQLFQDCIAEVRSARAVLAASNAASGMGTAPRSRERVAVGTASPTVSGEYEEVLIDEAS